jgi:putative tryptophan/tyrosine transport system substrate-binding protein
VRQVGILTPFAEDDAEAHSWIGGFIQSLADLGWRDGQTIHIESRWGNNSAELVRALAKGLVALQPDVILSCTILSTVALFQITRSVPIVFVQITDPVGQGFVVSMARPDGNMTGFTQYDTDIAGKWLQILKEIDRSLVRVIVLFDAVNPASVMYARMIQNTAPSFDMQFLAAGVHDADEILRAFDTLADYSSVGVIVLQGPVILYNRLLIIRLSDQHRLPTIYPFRYFAEAGGLVSYGVNPADPYHRAATYVDRILKGEKPADLPVQAPTKYELVVNLKTAKSLGLEVPRTLLAQSGHRDALS